MRKNLISQPTLMNYCSGQLPRFVSKKLRKVLSETMQQSNNAIPCCNLCTLYRVPTFRLTSWSCVLRVTYNMLIAEEANLRADLNLQTGGRRSIKI